jgi:hypothetical protein
MKTTKALIRRNIKLFFKDKGLFFTSLITPLILLVLYTTFLGNVYRDSFLLSIPEFMQNEVSNIIDGCVGGQLISSLWAVSCITVAFCSNMPMVQDKLIGAHNDISVTPVKHTHVAISYYAATFLVTLIINLVALVAGLIYIAAIGWYLTVSDVLFLILDILLAVLFVRNCKLCTSLSTTSSQYAAAILCSHSLTETVLVFSLSVRGLECSFHRLIYLYVFIQKVLYAIQRAKLLFFFRMAKKCKGIFTK